MSLNQKKEFKSRHLCVARPAGRRGWFVYDFGKKRQVLKPFWRSEDGLRARGAPLMGYLCEGCQCFNNFEKLYLVDGKVLHESCGIGVSEWKR